MNPFKKVLGTIYFVYAIVLFVATMAIVAIPTLLSKVLPEPKRANFLHPIFDFWISSYLPLVFCFVKRKGLHNFKKGENYVVIFNHNSMMDVPVSATKTPGANKTLGKVELTKIPLFNIIYKSGAVIVDRKNIKSRKESISKMEDVLKMGLHLCLFPEGTRNKTEKPLLPFYDGAFNTAIRAQKDIIPAMMFNTKKVYSSKNKFWGWPHTIHLHFLEPFSTKGLTTDDTNAFKAKVRQTMEDYYIANEIKL